METTPATIPVKLETVQLPTVTKEGAAAQAIEFANRASAGQEVSLREIADIVTTLGIAFGDKLDPKSLPPELEPVIAAFNQMMAVEHARQGYTIPTS